MCPRLLLILLLLAVQPLALAHDPGLSRTVVQLHSTGLELSMVYARQDIESQVSMDSNLDGSISASEFSVAMPQLYSMMGGVATIRENGAFIQPVNIDLQQVSGDGVRVSQKYVVSASSAITIQVPLLAKLARGHRQYLTVYNTNGQVISQHILSAQSSPVAIHAAEEKAGSVFYGFVVEGVRHIWIGFDHILFLLTLLLPAVLVFSESRWVARQALRPAAVDVLKVVTAFTVAHSITLALAVLDIVTLPPELVEPVIAFSVLITALNNLRPVFPASRWQMAFGFGLIHGFGFAGVLLELGLSANALLSSLLGFNLGVELGQLAIVLLVFPVAAVLRYTRLYRIWFVRGGSTVAALVALVWMFERIPGSELLGF